MSNSNAEAKRLREQQKRTNAFNNRRYEKITATNKNYNTIRFNSITVLLEDDGYAFDYVSQLLHTTFNYLNFDLIGAHGEGGIKHIISFINTDLLIVVCDKSNNISLIQQIDTELKRFKVRNIGATAIQIMPKAFEEIMLSFAEIPKIIKNIDKQGLQLLELINDYVTGKITDYSLANFVIKNGRVNNDMILEDWIEKITNNTQYFCTHKPSSISDCWLIECDTCHKNSNNCISIEVKPIGNYIAKSKIEYIALSSLGYFITRAIDNYIGNTYRTTICNLIDEKSIIKEI